MTVFARAAAFAAALTIVAASSAAAQAGTIRVTIAGGPHAGTYQMSDQCEITPDQFPAMHIMAFDAALTAPPKGPKTMEFFSTNGKGKPDGFVVAVKFLKANYEIYAIPREQQPASRALPQKGRGTVTVKRTPAGRTATFRGQTADGVKMEGSVECK